MAKEIVWSSKFRNELLNIFAYWDAHNQSTAYSTRLAKEIKNTFQLVGENNLLGKETTMKNVRVIIVEKFLVFYRITQQNILVLAIFDGRRNPHHKKIR